MKRCNMRQLRRAFWDRICAGRFCVALLALLFSAVAAATVFEGIERRWNGVVTGVLTLLLLFLPALCELLLSIRLGSYFKITAYLFIFSAGMLGEMADFYGRIPFFDDLLHVISGFLFAALGVAVATICAGRAEEGTLPALLTASFSVCFSVGVGVLWELFEYAADRILHTDMQKDTLLHALHSVFFSDGTARRVLHIGKIEQSVILAADGQETVLFGYLDIGLFDTMNDLVMNLLGAIVFCALLYRYLKGHGGRLAACFIPAVRRRGVEK